MREKEIMGIVGLISARGRLGRKVWRTAMKMSLRGFSKPDVFRAMAEMRAAACDPAELYRLLECTEVYQAAALYRRYKHDVGRRLYASSCAIESVDGWDRFDPLALEEENQAALLKEAVRFFADEFGHILDRYFGEEAKA